MHNYRELKVWNKSVELATAIYENTVDFPVEEKYGLISQIRRSAVSIASNIAEGAGRGTTPQFIQFLTIAYGSCYELSTQLIISKNLNYLTNEQLEKIVNQITEIQKMIYRLKESIEVKV